MASAVNNDTNGDADKEQASKGESSNFKVSMGESGNRMSLPDNFPKGVIPLLDDANIVNVNDNKDAKALGLTYITSIKMEEAFEFYRKAFKGAENYSEIESKDTYMITCEKENYMITAVITAYEGDSVCVGFDIGMQNIE